MLNLEPNRLEICLTCLTRFKEQASGETHRWQAQKKGIIVCKRGATCLNEALFAFFVLFCEVQKAVMKMEYRKTFSAAKSILGAGRQRTQCHSCVFL